MIRWETKPQPKFANKQSETLLSTCRLNGEAYEFIGTAGGYRP
jgi:hypothetical protein